MITEATRLISLHGGHSGEFCCHARDTLEDIVREYIRKGFEYAGITEHIPPSNDDFLYPDEKNAGLNARKMCERFEKYIAECRRLRNKYASDITIFVAFETETYSGSYAFVRKLVEQFAPDYVVGSVHHVDDIPIDYSESLYRQAVLKCGGTDLLYRRYFDIQQEMILTLKPLVVGHFDLIRIFDPDYLSRLRKPEIAMRIRRNLNLMKDLGLILDFNVRALSKGASEPYISRHILEQALLSGISVIPGDDSHSVETVGLNVEKGIRILRDMGFGYDITHVSKLLSGQRHC